MSLLELAQQIGVIGASARQIAGTGGGEYHCPCPSCGGKDRLFIQPNRRLSNGRVGYYKCRVCKKSGDTIQFCIDFLGQSFEQAVEYTGGTLQPKKAWQFSKKKSHAAVSVKFPSKTWLARAELFVDWAHAHIWKQQDVLDWLSRRGISQEAISYYKLGWCPNTINRPGEGWGLAPTIHIKTNKEKNTLWFPAGLVVPHFEHGSIVRLKIRRKDYKPNDKYGKYVEIRGSANGLKLIGNKASLAMVIVESELDAIALSCAMPELLVLAVGGCKKNFDYESDFYASAKKKLLVCYDNDDAGLEQYLAINKIYKHAKPYPVPQELGKDIGEAVQNGLDIRSWLLKALPENILNEQKIECTESSSSTYDTNSAITQNTLFAENSWRGGGDRG